jgi:ABC-type branched-subunit amino acid transport system permease subunit
VVFWAMDKKTAVHIMVFCLVAVFIKAVAFCFINNVRVWDCAAIVGTGLLLGAAFGVISVLFAWPVLRLRNWRARRYLSLFPRR